MGDGVWSVRPAFGPPPRQSAADAEVGIMAAAAEATLIGSVIDADELALIARRQRGEISREVFLWELREATMAKLRAQGVRRGLNG